MAALRSRWIAAPFAELQVARIVAGKLATIVGASFSERPSSRHGLQSSSMDTPAAFPFRGYIANENRGHIEISEHFAYSSRPDWPIKRDWNRSALFTAWRAKDCSSMWITNNIAARTLIWLAAITIPVQGLPAAPCGCIGGKSCCQRQVAGSCGCTGAKVCRCGETGPRRTPAKSCCVARLEKETCRSTSGSTSSKGCACQCGTNCQCGSSKEPREPATPPVEHNNPTEKVVSDSLAVVSVATVYQSRFTRRSPDASVELDARAALDRCAALCRFTL